MAVLAVLAVLAVVTVSRVKKTAPKSSITAPLKPHHISPFVIAWPGSLRLTELHVTWKRFKPERRRLTSFTIAP
ncbi:MAG: hypothetical protein ACLGI6_06905 [Gammaproteobacteria bacterium]